MKHKMLLLSIVLGLALPASASMAAEDNAAEMKPDVQKKVKPKVKNKVKRHSHMEEKTGFSPKAPDESMHETEGSESAKQPLHLHPRDMK